MAQRLTRTLILICFLILTYSALRLGFYWLHASTFANLTFYEIFHSMILGLRFDLSAIAITNGLFFLAYLIPWGAWPPKWVKTLGLLSWWSVNCLFVMVGLFDLEYYAYRGKRLTYSSLAIADEVFPHIIPSLLDYAHLWAVFILFCTTSFFGMKKLLKQETKPAHPLNGILILLGSCAVIVLMARGGTQVKPLILANAFQGTNPLTAHLALNSTFSLLRSQKAQELKRLNYFAGWQKLEKYLDKNRSYTFATSPKTAVNFVVIILESFGKEYMGKPPNGFTPFLQQLAEQGSSFEWAFANGRRSIEAMTAIFGGIPNLMDDPLITSAYQTNRIEGLPKILQNMGYETIFFHGGHDGTMFFDAQAQILGFRSYKGEKAYPSKGDRDGHWGVFDEPFLQFTADEIDKLKQPFFAGVFTLSSHYPYKIPEPHLNRFPKGNLAIHETIGYADYALKEFFRKAQDMPWFQNTLFVITGDHTSSSSDPKYQSPLGFFRVPLVIYHPGRKLALNTQKITQHIDIMPTLLAYVNAPQSSFARFGRPIQSPLEGQALLYQGQTHYLVRQQWVAQRTPDDHITLYQWHQDPHLKKPLDHDSNEMASTLKANLQYYYNGLIEDRLNW